jgi:pantoate--beta-alanine ligase
MAADGVRDCAVLLAALRALIAKQPAARIDYLAICHQATLQEQAQLNHDSVLLLAVFVGATRLIDNGPLLPAG